MAQAIAREGLGPRSRSTLMIAVLFITVWQLSVGLSSRRNDDSWRVHASAGVHHERDFTFYLRHLGLYPLVSHARIREDTRAEAERLLREHPESLRLDIGLTFRSGDRGRVYLYLFDSWLRGDSLHPVLLQSSAAGFILALQAFFFALWWLRRPLLGGMLVALIGSNPFQIFAVYSQDNVFGWAITSMLFAGALSLPLLHPFAPRSKVPWALALTTGLFFATARTVRSETASMLVAIAVIYLVAPALSWRKRVAMLALMFASFSLAGSYYSRLFTRQVETVNLLVAQHGGTPYLGPVEPYHEFWHPVWCGLGDFDTRYGHQWNDTAAYTAAFGAMRLRSDLPRGLTSTDWLQRISYDGDGVYPLYFFEAPGYHAAIRDVTLAHIREAPGWYFTILAKRTQRILTDTTPATLAWANKRIALDSAWLGALWVAAFAWAIARRRRLDAMLLLLSTPLSLVPLVIYSGGGTTHYGCAHLFAVGVLSYRALLTLVRAGDATALLRTANAPSP